MDISKTIYEPLIAYGKTVIANKYITTALSLCGFAISLKKVLSVLVTGYQWFVQPGKDIVARYGKGSWAVVTGASDGIGKGFCYRLAELGFNVVLIARNKEKLEKVAKELKDKFPSLQTRVVVANFAESSNPALFEKIYSEIQDLDISILVNNVGIMGDYLFHESSIKSLFELLTVNSLSVLHMTRVLLKKLSTRGKRAAVLTVNAGAALRPIPFLDTYGATKRFGDFLVRALAEEYANTIDFLCLTPAGVSTPMTLNHKEGGLTISAYDCAKEGLKKLGVTTQSPGHWKHYIAVFGIRAVPSWMIQALYPVLEFKGRQFYNEKRKLAPSN